MHGITTMTTKVITIGVIPITITGIPMITTVIGTMVPGTTGTIMEMAGASRQPKERRLP